MSTTSVEKDLATAMARIRRATQSIIEELGADGPQDLETAIVRVVEALHERKEYAERLQWGVVVNAGRRTEYKAARWMHVADATGFGRTSAKQLCRDAGFDPDETVSEESWEESEP